MLFQIATVEQAFHKIKEKDKIEKLKKIGFSFKDFKVNDFSEINEEFVTFEIKTLEELTSFQKSFNCSVILTDNFILISNTLIEKS